MLIGLTNIRSNAEFHLLGVQEMQTEYGATEGFSGLPLPEPTSTGEDLFRMAIAYSSGQGGAPIDLVSAHMLFNLAAMRGSDFTSSRAASRLRLY